MEIEIHGCQCLSVLTPSSTLYYRNSITSLQQSVNTKNCINTLYEKLNDESLILAEIQSSLGINFFQCLESRSDTIFF